MATNLFKQTRIGGVWAFVALFAATVLILVTAHRLDRLLYSSYIQGVRSETYLELVEVREGFGKIIQSQSLVLRELATFIGDNPDVDQKAFARRVRTIPGVNDFLISVGGAPNMVISLIAPKEGNQGALGLDYRKNQEQLPAVLRMIQSGSELITGPINLVQGGKGLILRAPVYLPNTSGYIDEVIERDLWGIVSLVLDYDRFIEQSGITDAAEKYDLFIDVVGKIGGDTEVSLYGDSALTAEDTVNLQFDFAFENWIIYAVTKGGWPETYPDQWRQRAIMALAGVALLGTLIYILWLSQTRTRSKALLKSGIEALNDGFVMFDQDDRLILNNTKYREIYDLPQDVLKPGTPYVDMMGAWIARQAIPPTEDAQTEWLSHRHASGSHSESHELEQHFPDGRVIKVSNYPLNDGGSVGLRVDVTELSRAKVAAEAASKAKTDFMGVLSHELRTPLTVIMGVAQLLKNARLLRSSKALLAAHESGEVPSEQAKAMLDDVFTQLDGLMYKMCQSGEHLKHLINELLDVAMIESGSLLVEPAICRVKDIVDPVFSQLSTLSKAKGLDLHIVQEAETVFADEMRVRQILFNLIGNAIKFTETGFVRLHVKAQSDTVMFEVSDSGVGISAEEFASIFDVFYQVDSTATRHAGGAGMGLAISRSLAELQNGSLTVSSKVGEGSCFVLTLPTKSGATGDPAPGL